MDKLAIVKIERGDWENGFPVSLQIGEDISSIDSVLSGNLPGKPEIVGEYEKWRSLYGSLPNPLRLDKPAEQVTNSSEIVDECREAAGKLSHSFNTWLDSSEFNRIIKKLQTKLNPEDNIRIVIQTDDLELRRLPWHDWDLFEGYKYAEFALSASHFERVDKAYESTARKQLKILAILGNSEGIDVEKDREFLAKLPNAKVEFLVEPQRKEITTNLWERNWDVLFFAGHSNTEEETGVIYYNKTESLDLSQLKGGLKRAIQGGLKLAIFNSCNGLGLARDLEDLCIPQTIVMREPVPDVVAGDFLKYFLREFSLGKSLYMAVRNARERLHDDWGNRIPGASWLPTICQNLAAKPLIWEGPKRDIFQQLALGGLGVFFAAVFGVVYAYLTAYKFYESDRYPITMRYPANWEVQREAITPEIKFISPKESPADSFQEFLSVTVEPVGREISLEAYTKETLDRISRSFTKDAINAVPHSLAGEVGRKISYRPNASPGFIRHQYWAIKNNNAYIITYTFEEGKKSPQLEKKVEKIIQSFTINN